MNILVTGGCGFIGSNFIRYILKKYNNINIINLDKLTYAGNKENLIDIEDDKRYSFVLGNICDPEAVDRCMKDVDMVFHFAAESHVDNSIKGANPFVVTNVIGTQVLLDSARKNNIKRFVYISTDEIYGSREYGYFTENDRLEPNSPYSASKAAGEMLCRSYYATHKLPIIITRSSNNFGPYQHPEKFIPLFITNLLENKKVPLYGDGLNVRDWIYVEDNCKAIKFVSRYGKIGEIYNIGGGNEKKNIDITRYLLEKTGLDQNYIQYVEDRLGHDRRYALSTVKIRELGWENNRNFDSALNMTIQWYKENEEWWKKIKSNMKQEENKEDNSNDKDRMNDKKIMIFGCGQLGNLYSEYFKNKGDIVINPKIDIRNENDVRSVIEREAPNYIINTAAKTNIDWCEKNRTECFEVNTLGAEIIGRLCAEKGIYLIHLSSGCIQESKTKEEIHGEEDPVNPLCFYSWTKVWADQLLLDLKNRKNLRVLILRPRQLLSSVVSPRNAVTKLLTYTKFIDTPNSCTIVEDLLDVTNMLIEKNAVGVYNVVNPGITSPYEIALMLKEIVKPEMVINKISKEELNSMTFAKRIDSVLSAKKLENDGIILKEIHIRLREILEQFKENLSKDASKEVMEKTKEETRNKLLV